MKCKVGDKVQIETRGRIARDCEVVAFFPMLIEGKHDVYSKWQSMSDEERKPYQERVRVRFTDDGTEAEFESFNIARRDSELERNFRLESNGVMAKINEHLTAARNALTMAQELSEKHGIPFSAGISPLSQSYFPKSFEDMWAGKFRDSEDDNVVDEMYETVSNITGAHKGEYVDSGWEHSAVCY